MLCSIFTPLSPSFMIVALKLVSTEPVVKQARNGDGIPKDLKRTNRVAEYDQRRTDQENILEDAGQRKDKR